MLSHHLFCVIEYCETFNCHVIYKGYTQPEKLRALWFTPEELERSEVHPVRRRFIQLCSNPCVVLCARLEHSHSAQYLSIECSHDCCLSINIAKVFLAQTIREDATLKERLTHLEINRLSEELSVLLPQCAPKYWEWIRSCTSAWGLRSLPLR